MFTSLLIASLAFADAPATVATAQARGLTEAEDLAVSHALAEAKTKTSAAKKATTKAKAKAVASGDSATAIKCDEVLARLNALDVELNTLATHQDISGLSAKVIDLGAKLDGINGQLMALTSAIDALPTSEEVRKIVKEELASSSTDELAEIRTIVTTATTTITDASTPAPAAATSSNIGWFAGAGGSVEVRSAYEKIIAPLGAGLHVAGGLTWEGGSALGTGLLAYGGWTTGNGAQLGSDLVVYKDGDVDLGGGVGAFGQYHDVWGESLPAATLAGGEIVGYVRFGGDVVSVVTQPYMRLGAFSAGKDGGLATAYGLRLTAAFGSH